MKRISYCYKLLTFLLLIQPSIATSQITMISDFSDKPLSTYFREFVQADNITYFVADDALWRTDGTTEGTFLLTSGYIEYNSLDIGKYELVNNTLFFFKNGNNQENGLWISDGTIKGTKKISNAYTYGPILKFNGIVYFHADDMIHGSELWRSDGTETGTYMLMDIRQGPQGSYPSSFIAEKKFLIFSCSRQTGSSELWRTDGTVSGTQFVYDIDMYFSSYSKNYNYSFSFKNNIYFSGYDSWHGSELWKTDGTDSGTKLVKEINPGSASSYPSDFIAIDNYLFFLANDGSNGGSLWRTDGTAEGTFMIIKLGLTGYSKENLVVDGILYFYLNQDGHSRLWKTDGTASGTSLLKDFYFPGTGYYIQFLCYENGYIYFNGYDSQNGNQLWKSDGTPIGTEPENIFTPISESGNIYCLNHADRKIFLKTVDTNYSNARLWVYDIRYSQMTLLKDFTDVGDYLDKTSISSNDWFIFPAKDSIAGYELWGTDGTNEGTILIKDISPGTIGTSILRSELWKNELYITSYDYDGEYKLYKTDGTAGGMKLLKTFNIENSNQSFFQSVTGTDHSLFFDVGNELWLIDGSQIRLVKKFATKSSDRVISNPIYQNGFLYFFAIDTINGQALWKSDGTTAGTTIVKNHLASVRYIDDPSHYSCLFGNRFAFVGIDSAYGRELWISDGTEAGTYIVKDVYPGIFGCAHNLTSYHNLIIYEARDSIHEHELWRSDGTPDGTTLVKDINPGGMGSYFNQPVEFKGLLYFIANDSNYRIGLYRTDGTSSGTSLVKTIYKKMDWGGYSNIKTLDSVMLFMMAIGNSEGETYEIWCSDGTATGTYPIKKGIQTNENIDFNQSVVLNHKVYFSFVDSVAGNELWCSDGTEKGTYLVGEINPGIVSSNPMKFKTNGKEVLFCAESNYYGEELFKYLPSPAPTTQSYGIEFYNIQKKQFSIRWKRGNGENCVVFIRKGNTGAAVIHNGADYQPVNVFPYGDPSDIPQWYCIYNDTGNYTTVYGLQPGTEYRVMVIEYNDFEGIENYNYTISSFNPANQYTLIDQINTESLEIKVYPNPTSGKLLILNSEGANIYLFNSYGSLILETTHSSDPNLIDLSLLPDGIYFLSFKTGRKIITKKVILNRRGG
jgi:ELWxxDGT repeat protein